MGVSSAKSLLHDQITTTTNVQFFFRGTRPLTIRAGRWSPAGSLEYINQLKRLTIAFAEVSHLDIEPAGRAEFQLHQSESNENEL
jgi:hypothetical protein